MAYELYNVDIDPNTIYFNVYSSTLVQQPVTQNITGDTTIVTNINGASGPNITITGGSTGLVFSTGSPTVAMSGILVEPNGGTGQSSYVKGDILIASAVTTLNKQGVGANGTVLTSDSSQATGVRWADPSAAELNVTTIDFTSTPYNVTDADDVILVNANGGIIAVELPDATTAQQKVYYIKKIDATANAVNINADAGQTIDGAPTQSTTTQYESFGVVPDNATGNWSIV